MAASPFASLGRVVHGRAVHSPPILPLPPFKPPVPYKIVNVGLISRYSLGMHKPVKYVEKGLTVMAKGAWSVFDALNSIRPNESFTV